MSIYIFKIQYYSLATDVDRTELHVVMETVQTFKKVAKMLASKGLYIWALHSAQFAKNLLPFTN